MVYENILNDVNEMQKDLKAIKNQYSKRFLGHAIARNEKGVNRCYKLSYLEREGIKLVNFIPSCSMTEEDMGIMGSWEKHFKDRGCPYVIVEKGNTLVLYKESKED